MPGWRENERDKSKEKHSLHEINRKFIENLSTYWKSYDEPYKERKFNVIQRKRSKGKIKRREMNTIIFKRIWITCEFLQMWLRRCFALIENCRFFSLRKIDPACVSYGKYIHIHMHKRNIDLPVIYWNRIRLCLRYRSIYH